MRGVITLTASTTGRLGVAVLLLASGAVCGCQRKPPSPPKPPPGPTTPARAPEEVVKAYLEALENRHYRVAYECLTSESRSKHPSSEFRRDAQLGGPAYDLDRVEVESLGTDEVRVSVGIAEDPAFQSFALKREENQWRIVFNTGSPAAPSAN